MPYLGIFRVELWKTIVIFEIGTLEFVYLQTLVQKWKFLSLGPKMPCLDIFGLEFLKPIVLFEINTLKYVLLQSLVKK